MHQCVASTQFEVVGKDHAAGRPVFNRVVGLKDGWGK
jgi:hypothetical protein